MDKSKEKKLFCYIKVGKLHRVRSLFKKYKPSHLTAIVDRKGRTPLHVCCLLGDDAIMRLLLKNGAKVEVTDTDGNTPIHFALKYAMETTRFTAFNDLILPLLNVCGSSSSVLDVKNNDGKSARECLSQLKMIHAQRREEVVAQRRQQRRMKSERPSKKNLEDLEWERKLKFEAGQEDFSKYNQDDYMETTHETYDEWVEKIMRERWQKKASSKQKAGVDCKPRHCQEDARQRTKQLEMEHEAYMTQMSVQRQKLKLTVTLAKYEEKCKVMFDGDSSRTIKFSEVSWPCQGDTNRMLDLVKRWLELKSGEERKKFLKEQQVRWHPDKFLQKCGNRLDNDERDKIIEQVKELSQEINSLLDLYE